MNYGLSQQESGMYVYFLIFLVSLGLTALAYGAFPLIYARSRKKTITKRKYRVLCYGINFLVMVLFIAVNGESSGAPYLLWTWVFSKSGLKTLQNNGLLEEYKSTAADNDANRLHECKKYGNHENQYVDLERPDQPLNKIRFCRKCGEALKEDSRFCFKCGTEIYFDNKVH